MDEVRREVNKMWKVITCPHVVHIMGTMEKKGKLSIVMEYLVFGDLWEFNKKYMMKCECWARKVKMIHEITLGMNFLHNLKPVIIHADLKLKNILVGDGFKVQVN